MFYILAVEDNSETLELIRSSLRTFPYEVVMANTSGQAIEVVKEKGFPEIIISGCSDKELSDSLIEQNREVPTIVCGAAPFEELRALFPKAHGHIHRTQISLLLLETVTSILAGPKSLLNYIPVSLSILQRFGQINFDLYMKLSFSNYVKIFQKGDFFLSTDAERFNHKEVSHLYVSTPDAPELLTSIEKDLGQLVTSKITPDDDSLGFTLESLEVTEKLTYNMGWTPEVVEAAKKSISSGIKIISEDPDIRKILKHKFKPGSLYSRHISLVSLLCCCMCQQLGWTSEKTQLKLAIAALMHDLAVDDDVYLSLDHWNEIARNPKAKDPDTLKYRNHPIEAVTMLRNVQNLPEDIDLIIIQHHETGDGNGYPYNVSPGRISPMTAVLLVAEDLVNFIREDDLNASLRDFINQREMKYQADPFVKVFRILKENIRA